MTSRDKDYTAEPKKDKKKSPAFQFYPKDWLTDDKVVAMTSAERGDYITLLCLDWLNDGLNPEYNKLLNGGSSLVRSCFVDHSTKMGFVTNPRLLVEREKQDEWHKRSSKAGKASGIARKIKALQNEPKPNQGSTKAEPNTNSSSSSSSSSSNNIINKELKPRTPKIQKIEVEPDVWLSEADLEAARIAHGAPQTTEMLKAISDYQLATGKRYKDHAAVLRQWFRRDQNRPKPTARANTRKSNYEEGIEILMRGSNDIE